MATITGTAGNDVFTGGTGDDWAKPTLRERVIGSAGDDTLVGGGGNDTVDYSGLGKAITAFRGVVIDKGGLGTDKITNFLNIVGATGQANTLDATGTTGGAKIDAIQAKYRSGIGERSNDLGGNLITKDGIFGSNEIAAQFNLLGGSDSAFTHQT